MERGRRSLITNSFFRFSPPLQLLARSYPDFFIPSRWCGFIDHDSSSQLATSLPVPRFSWSSYKPFRDLIVLQTNRSIRACWIINENNCSFGHLCPRNDISGTRFWFFLTSNLSNIEPVWWLESRISLLSWNRERFDFFKFSVFVELESYWKFVID